MSVSHNEQVSMKPFQEIRRKVVGGDSEHRTLRQGHFTQ